MIKVLVADDHAVVRKGLRQILSETEDIRVGGEASNGAELGTLLHRERWDVLVLDVNLGGRNGLELLEDIRQDHPQLGVIILTVYSEDQYAIRALRSGASGFLTKEAAPDKLIDAVRKVALGGKYVSEALGERLATHLSSPQVGAPHDALSNRELQILLLIASGSTVSAIAKKLNLSVKTVSTHRTRLLAKMGMKTNAELTHYAIKSKLTE